MSGLLAELYSAIDSKKRQLKGLLGDPVETIRQGLLNFRDDQNAALTNNGVAYQLPGYQSVLLQKAQIDAAQKKSADDAANMAFGAMSFKYPQDEALAIAQRNGEKMLGLPANNTPEMRAKAMGFEDGWGHGSPINDLTYLKSSRIGAQGPGAYATNYLKETGQYAAEKDGATSYPLFVKKSEALVSKHNNPYDELGVSADDELLSELFSKGKSAIITTQEKTPEWLLKHGVPEMPERSHFVSVKPENFRSRFAAFDPARINENDLLAGMLPFGLLTDEETRKRMGFQ